MILSRKKLAMQIVPYMPIHPAQLISSDSTTAAISETKSHDDSNDDERLDEQPSPLSIVIDDVNTQNDHDLFKRPLMPTAYTVEEPNDNAVQRSSTMKRYINT
jgi:hypothetical protein